MGRVRTHMSGVGSAAAALLVGLLVTQTAPARAENGKMVRVGVTQIASHAALDADRKGFEAALANAGFKEGVSIVYDRQNAQGDMQQAAAIAKKFIDAKVDLIHGIATPTTQAVVKGTGKIPIVFSSITDPVNAGIVPKDSAPGRKTGTNVTGVSDLWPVFLQMETYSKFVPKAKKWGTIYNPAEANSVMHIKAMREAAKKLGLELVEVTIGNSREVAKAAASLVGKVQAITITSDNTTVTDLESIVAVCSKHKIPLFAGDVDSVSRGAVAAYGLDYYLVGYSAGKKAALVLKGVKPGDIPWGPVEKFSLVINEKAARAQGVTIAPGLLKKADKVLR
ncbi:ABC transporter substrate-binding protein [Trichlorobacter ammonificans]|uniref:ABC transporter substrate-binding protein n=1 Tax=Trichlorobacter ammonificans TaxID=2916410 RepID=A0ABM9D6J2_9BACT|nr:ABC transporter substrate-binding protein [Trichlorobacter ammonificans]CAH2030041.1 ABC transporter substrate-binding protein [Trichlorobacter ammonificans]